MPASGLWLPPSAQPKVSRELRENTREWEHALLSMMHQEGGILDHWNRELKQIDPNLRLMQAMENAVVPGVIAGFYHLVRLRDPAKPDMLMVVPLRGPNDEFVEPTDYMLEALRMSDLQNEAAVRARERHDLQAEAARLRAIAREEDARRDEGLERFLAATRTQVLMSPDVAWTQNNSAAARRARGAARKRKKRR